MHLITLNLSRRFREEAGLSEAEWIQTRHQLNPENVHLVSSAIYEGYRSAYDGSPPANAAEFQRQIVNTYIKDIRSAYEGRAILHTNDWMAGGVITPYAKLRGVPILHTVHNTHTGHVPLDMFYGVNLQALWDMLYLSDTGSKAVDCQATAIRNATKVSYVGEKFLKEIVGRLLPPETRSSPGASASETKARYYGHDTLVIPNGISPDVFPENQEENPEVDQARAWRSATGPYDNLIEAKKANLVKFQKKTGLRGRSRRDPVLLAVPAGPAPEGRRSARRGRPAVRGRQPRRADRRRGRPGRRGQLPRRRHGPDRLRLRREDLLPPVLPGPEHARLRRRQRRLRRVPLRAVRADRRRRQHLRRHRHQPRHRRLQRQDRPAEPAGLGRPIDQGNGVLFRDYDAGGLWWGLRRPSRTTGTSASIPGSGTSRCGGS